MSLSPLVSILIPTFNREPFIRDCILSAINQTYDRIEIVIVDNCSTDLTLSICKEFQDLDSRVKVFQNDRNIGPVRNWIRCAEEATGHYIKVLFSDDILRPTCVEALVRAIEETPDAGLAYCAASIGPEHSTAPTYYSAATSGQMSSLDYGRRMLVARAPYSPCASLMRKRSFLENLHLDFPTEQPHPFDKHGAGPDCMVQLITASQYKNVAHVNQPLVYFRSHSGSFTAENLNNQVHSAYISSLALFAKNYLGNSTLLGFLLLTWIDFVRRNGWISPFRYFSQREARGSMVEFLWSIPSALPLILNRLKRNSELRAANPDLKI